MKLLNDLKLRRLNRQARKRGLRPELRKTDRGYQVTLRNAHGQIVGGAAAPSAGEAISRALKRMR